MTAPTRPRRRASRPAAATADETARLLRHWREAVPDDRMAHLVKDTTRALVRALQMRLAEHGVSFGHWAFLRVLWEGDGLTQRELSEEAGVMEPTTFAAVNAMEARGYVVRRPRADDRRKVSVFLTAKGRRLRDVLVPLAERVNDVALDGVRADDVATTRRVLLAMLENLAADERDDGSALRMPSTREIARVGKSRIRRTTAR